MMSEDRGNAVSSLIERGVFLESDAAVGAECGALLVENALTVEQRRDQVAETDRDRLAVEREEEHWIIKAIAGGAKIIRRPDVDPRAHPASVEAGCALDSFDWRMSFSENRCPLFRDMR
jgi:hypothetical protein